MDVKIAVETRHSIRRFKTQPVERTKINECLEAARVAPSACNSQPWHYIVIDDPTVKEAFCNEIFSGIYGITSWAAKAPVLIAVVSDRGNFVSRLGNFFRRTELYLVDQGISGEHFVLRAWELGLGTCWIGWFNSDKAEKFFKLPKGHKIEHLFALGYPDENPQKAGIHGRKKLEEITSYNRYK